MSGTDGVQIRPTSHTTNTPAFGASYPEHHGNGQVKMSRQANRGGDKTGRAPEEIDVIRRLRQDDNDAEALAIFLSYHPEYVKGGLTVYKKGLGMVRPDSNPEAETNDTGCSRESKPRSSSSNSILSILSTRAVALQVPDE